MPIEGTSFPVRQGGDFPAAWPRLKAMRREVPPHAGDTRYDSASGKVAMKSASLAPSTSQGRSVLEGLDAHGSVNGRLPRSSADRNGVPL